jgi:Na+-driven multidrug efflux pump
MYTLALDQKNDDKAKEVLSHSFVISLGLGLFTMMVQILGSKAVISNLAGSSTSIIPYAMKYARIRSLGSIVGIPTMFGQAAFLARRDPITPLKAVLLGSFLNFIGDILLVIGFGYGIEGAAIATVISQFGCALYLLYGIMSSQSSKETSSSSTIQQKLYNLSHRITFPSWKQLKSYLLFCYPIFFVLFAKSFLFSYSTYACSNAGEASIASHQISINLFCFFGYFGEAVSQMSQTFLPGLLKNRGKSEFNGEKSNPTLENIESMQGKNETDALEVEKKTVKYQTKLRNRFQSKAYILFGRICKLGLGLGFLSGVFAYYFQRFGHRVSHILHS